MIVSSILLATLLAHSTKAAVIPTLFTDSDSLSSSGKHGAVASEVGQCSEVGIDTLKIGGSAADAIIATALCVGTISAYHSGLGGGGFMIVRFPTDDGSFDYEMIDFRERAPAASNETMYTGSSDPTASTIGGLAVGVPGEVRGWQTLHRRHGKLPWSTVVAPAIKLARGGFTVTIDLAQALSAASYPFLLEDPLWAETYAPSGTLLTEGETCYRHRYADTLEKVAVHGPDAFYSGDIANNTIAAIIARGGIMTTEDLTNYSAIIRIPSNITYRNARIFSTVAPSSGSVVLSALKIFEGYDDYAILENGTSAAYNLQLHRIVEATKFAYGQRTNFGDPAYTANVSVLEQEYLEEQVAAEARSFIVDNQTFDELYYNTNNYAVLNDSGTSHIAAVDHLGMAVSLTTTVNLYWGSQVMTTNGIILNDEMDDFSSPGETNSFGFTASPANYIAPGKRPQSSIASSIAEDLETGELLIATGSAGGSRIITATLQNLHHVLDQGLSANESVHSSRWHDQLSGTTYFEWPLPQFGISGISNDSVDYMVSLGYNASFTDGSLSTSHVINRVNGTLFAAADPRKAAGRGYAY